MKKLNESLFDELDAMMWDVSDTISGGKHIFYEVWYHVGNKAWDRTLTNEFNKPRLRKVYDKIE